MFGVPGSEFGTTNTNPEREQELSSENPEA
jgi:hypothetical protein